MVVLREELNLRSPGRHLQGNVLVLGHRSVTCFEVLVPEVDDHPFADLRDVAEYQILHSEAGLEVRLVLRAGAAPETPLRARAALLATLERAGAIPPAIITVSVPALAREGAGAKLKLVQALPSPSRH